MTSDGLVVTEASPIEVETSVADRAHAVLLRAITTCELKPGAVLSERHHATRLGMSRTPFRQALHRLASEGLVNTEFNRTVRVSPLDPQKIEHFTVIREALEVALIRTVLTQGMPIDFPRLDALIREMASAIKAKDAVGYLECDEEFHLTICAASGNDEALDIMRRAWLHVNRLRYIEVDVLQGYRGSLAEHRSMVDGLRAGDVDAVAGAIVHHMQRSRDRLSELVRSLPESFVAQAASR